MSYITLSNMMSIIFDTDLDVINSYGRELYKKPIYMFSKYEEKKLFGVYDLFENPNIFLTETYKSRKQEDTYTMVYEGSRPAYHENIDCSNLRSDYQNFQIPSDIRERGREEVETFRNWFKEVEHLYRNDPDAFVNRLFMRWGIQTNVRAINAENSGAVEMENRKIEDLEKAIDKRIKEAGRFYYKSGKETEILKKYATRTYLVNNKHTELETENYRDKDIRELLEYYDKTFKKPLSQDLIHYYRFKLNPELKLEGKLLKGLGFKACANCF